MKFVRLFVLVGLLFLMIVPNVFAAQEQPVFPGDLSQWLYAVALVVLSFLSGLAAYGLQVGIRKVVPFLGEEHATALGAMVNRLLGLGLPVAVGLGLVYAMTYFGIVVADPWTIIVGLAIAQGTGQGAYQVQKSTT